MSAVATAYVELWDWSVFDRVVDLAAVAGPDVQHFALIYGTALTLCWAAQRLATR